MHPWSSMGHPWSSMVILGALEHAHCRLCASPSFVHPCFLAMHADTQTLRDSRSRLRETGRQRDTEDRETGRQRERDNERDRERLSSPMSFYTQYFGIAFRTVGTFQKRGLLTGRQSDATRSGAQQAKNSTRKRQQAGNLMAEAAIRDEPLHRMDALFEQTRPRYGSRRRKGQSAFLWTTRISDQRQNATGSPTQWSNKGFSSERRPKAGGTPGIRSLALLDQRRQHAF